LLTVEVDLSNLVRNIEIIKGRLTEDAKVAFVVKADGYGHGLTEVARVGERANLDYLAVSRLDSAKRLRDKGISTPILIFGPVRSEEEPAAKMLRLGVTPTITSASGCLPEELSREAKKRGVTAKVHLNVDTGMGRAGLFPKEVLPFLKKISGLENLQAEGIYSHLSAADSEASEDRKYTRNQIESFRGVLGALKDKGLLPPLRHIGNSAGFIQYENEVTGSPFNMVRLGSLLYGLPEVERPWIRSLSPVMSVFTRISEIRELPAGSFVGYGRSSRIGEDKRVGVLPAGYADGLSRKTSGKGEVVIENRKARIVGKISANHTVVDLSGIDDASVGDRVELIGKTNPAPALGEKIGASVLELLAPFGSREVNRIYSEDLTDKKTS